jgi:hypothetical protein
MITPTRRETLAAAAVLPAVLAVPAESAVARPPGRGDFDFLVGSWTVRHHRLKERLTGNTEWEHFSGTSTLWLTLDGLGTIDDNLLELPSGTYRAMGIRAFNPEDGKWSIWWLDARNVGVLDPPVRGGFKDGVGVFEGDDVLRGKPIRVRYTWSDITARTAHWEQAFSPDGGRTWEVNWRMDFTRA